MPRRGSFGHSRNKVSSLTALIASLRREARAAEDRAMFDAWQNGGEYGGKPVTDSRLLAYIKSRRDGFSTDDPLWAEWDNRHTQYSFSIGEQKIGLRYKQGKVGAGAVAAFYRDQLKSIPKDSAFYREVAGRAAQFARSAGGAARGVARGRATVGLRDKLNQKLYDQENFQAIEQYLTSMAKAEGLIAGSQTLTDADATDLQDMFNRGISLDGKTLYTLDDFSTDAKNHYGALTDEIIIRRKLGQQAVEAVNKRTRFLNNTVIGLNAIDERGQYERAQDNLRAELELAAGNPWATGEAYQNYTKSIAGIRANVSNQSIIGPEGIAPEFVGGIENEYQMLVTGRPSGKTVADLWQLGSSDDFGSQGILEDISASADDITRINSGKAYYGQVEPNGPLTVVDLPAGNLTLDDSLKPSLTYIAGQRRQVWLKGDPVKATVLRDTATGQTLSPTTPEGLAAIRDARSRGTLVEETSPSPIGYIFTNPVNGSRRYGVFDASGQMLFTETNPWSEDGSDSNIVNNGGIQTVFTGQLDAKGVPLVNVVQAVNIDTANPLLSDSTVSPKDLLALADEIGLPPDYVERYQSRLQRQEQERVATLSRRDLGFTDIAGVGQQTQAPSMYDPGNGPLAAQLAATRDTLRGAWQNGTKDDLYTPPPPPSSKAIQATIVKDDTYTPPSAPKANQPIVQQGTSKKRSGSRPVAPPPEPLAPPPVNTQYTTENNTRNR